MNIVVNHKKKTVAEAIALDSLLSDLNIEQQGIAVAINNQIITKSDWNNTTLKENDAITIIQATQGG